MLAIPPHYRSRMTSVNMMVFQVAGVLGFRAFPSLPHDEASGHYGRSHPELFR